MQATELESHAEPSTLVEFPVLMRLPDLRSAPPLLEPKATEVVSSNTEMPLRQTADTTVVERTSIDGPATAMCEDKTEAVQESVADAVPTVLAPVPTQATGVDTQNVRRQRALDRQRRHQQTEVPTKSWWSSHVPVILIGFLCALAFTIFMARKNRAVAKPGDEWAQEEIPELKIESGAPQVVSPSIITESTPVESISSTTKTPAANVILSSIESPNSLKTPPLLTAQKHESPSEVKSASNVAVDSKGTENPGSISEDYPTTGLPSLQPANKIAQAPDESGTTGPQYPTTNYPASWR